VLASPMSLYLKAGALDSEAAERIWYKRGTNNSIQLVFVADAACFL